MKKLKLFFAACALLVGVSNASAKNDVTDQYLKDANLSSLEGWGNPGRTAWKTDGAVNVVEFWNWSNQFSFTQIAKLPAGYYRLAVNAFYRNGGQGDGTNNNMAWIMAGEKKQNVVALNSMADLSGYAGSNDLYRAATAFSQGKFSNEFDFNVTGEGTTEVEIGFKGTCPNSGWCILGPVKIFQYTIDDYKEDYNAKVVEAKALYDSPMYPDDLAALKAAVVDESELTTIDAVIDADKTLSSAIIAANNSINAYTAVTTLSSQAQAIANVEYTEITSGSHSDFVTAIENFNKVPNSDAFEAAASTLKTAIKTYINNAEPKNDGEFFDVTCLMANPDFADNTITGWTKESTLNPNTRIQCNEFYGKASFDFYQIVNGLPNGSYTLGMKAFQRPGGYDQVYADYVKGINNATAKVYVNNDASTVKNIMEEMNATMIYVDPAGEAAFNSDKKPNGADGYIPNSMEGAAAWFAVDKYKTTVAALVEEGTLRLGFKDDAHSSDVWTLFDEFRLKYYGSSKMIYYKQYLPQLEAEIKANYLDNAAYAVLKDGQTEREALVQANAADAEKLNTEKELSDAIEAIIEARDNFVEAKAAYDQLLIAVNSTYNVGDGVFQMSSSQAELFQAEVATGTSIYNTGTADMSAVAIQTLSIASKYVLNAPDPEKRYWVTMHDGGQAWDGFAITLEEGGRSGEGDYAVKYLAAANANLDQALKFTAVEGNKYKISGIRVADGTELYLTGRLKGYEEGSNDQIRTINDATKALEISVMATATDNQFKLINETGTEISRNSSTPDNGVYAAGDVGSYFTITEASQATVDVTINADVKYATRIFPFTPTTWPDNVVAYSCEASSDNVLTLVEVAQPVANTPYILFADLGSPAASVSGWGTATETSYTAGWLTGVYEDTKATAGSYVLQNNNGNVAFYVVEAEKEPTVGAYRCYLSVPAQEGRSAYFFPGSGEVVTGINAAVKALTSGKAQIFNASGAQIPALQKGMNIILLEDGTTQKVVVQ